MVRPEIEIESQGNRILFKTDLPPLAETIIGLRKALDDPNERNRGISRRMNEIANNLEEKMLEEGIEPEPEPAQDDDPS